MCIRDRAGIDIRDQRDDLRLHSLVLRLLAPEVARLDRVGACLLYTSDAADERSSVDLGGRRIIKKKTKAHNDGDMCTYTRDDTDHREAVPT